MTESGYAKLRGEEGGTGGVDGMGDVGGSRSGRLSTRITAWNVSLMLSVLTVLTGAGFAVTLRLTVARLEVTEPLVMRNVYESDPEYPEEGV